MSGIERQTEEQERNREKNVWKVGSQNFPMANDCYCCHLFRNNHINFAKTKVYKEFPWDSTVSFKTLWVRLAYLKPWNFTQMSLVSGCQASALVDFLRQPSLGERIVSISNGRVELVYKMNEASGFLFLWLFVGVCWRYPKALMRPI